MDEWLQEFSNWTTEEEENLEELRALIETLLPGVSVLSLEEVTPPTHQRISRRRRRRNTKQDFVCSHCHHPIHFVNE